jgi:hypothetical protein
MICLASATISSSPHFSRLVGLFARVVSSSLAHRSMLSNPFLPESSQFDIPYIVLLPFSSASARSTSPYQTTTAAPKAMTISRV